MKKTEKTIVEISRDFVKIVNDDDKDKPSLCHYDKTVSQCPKARDGNINDRHCSFHRNCFQPSRDIHARKIAYHKSHIINRIS